MRPVSPQPQLVNNRYGYGAGGYRALWWILVTGLCLLGLYWGVIRLTQTVSNISENITGQDSRSNVDYYPEGGILSMMRYARSLPQQ
jgi:hypothetical protein